MAIYRIWLKTNVSNFQLFVQKDPYLDWTLIFQIDHDENHWGSVGFAKKGIVDVTINSFESMDLN